MAPSPDSSEIDIDIEYVRKYTFSSCNEMEPSLTQSPIGKPPMKNVLSTNTYLLTLIHTHIQIHKRIYKYTAYYDSYTLFHIDRAIKQGGVLQYK